MSINKPEVGISQQNMKNLSVKIFLINVCFVFVFFEKQFII